MAEQTTVVTTTESESEPIDLDVTIEQQPPTPSESDSGLSDSSMVEMIRETLQAQGSLFRETMQATIAELRGMIDLFQAATNRLDTAAAALEQTVSDLDQQKDDLAVEFEAVVNLRTELIEALPRS